MGHTIYTRFHEIAVERPADKAIIDDHNTLTYKQLDELACRIQTMLPQQVDGGVVGIVMGHGPLMIASILAVLRSGMAYIPIEHSIPVERKRFMIKEAQALCVITDKPDTYGFECPEVVITDKTVKSAPLDGQPDAEVRGDADTLAYILYTSGTTGRPKGIMVENRNVLNYAEAFKAEMGMGPGDVMLQYSVNTFDIFVEEVFATLLNGAALAIPGPRIRGDINKLLDFVERHGVTVISGFPYLLQDIDRTGRLPKSVRLLISGGDVLRHSYIANLCDKAMIYNTYGPSETTVCATYQRCDNIAPLADGTYPIGHAVKGVEVRVLDDKLQPVADGEVGEICILGAGVSRGYLGDRPEQRAFVELEGNQRLYRSGDLGYWLEDGKLAFVHRKDQQVMIWGKRVECSEVENVLCECAEVARAAVRPIVDSLGVTHLAAYIVPSGIGRFSVKSIRTKIGHMLSSFMLPEFIVRLKSMPLTPNGKVDSVALAAIPLSIH